MGSITMTGGGGVTSYVGMIVHSTTLDTEAKVKEIYGGTTWIRHSGYFLRGASSGVVANSAAITGGSDDAIVVKHSHNVRVRLLNGGSQDSYGIPFPETLVSRTFGSQFTISGGIAALGNDQPVSVQDAGNNGTNKNIPKYKSVYIWERTV